MKIYVHRANVKVMLARRNKSQNWLADQLGTSKQYLWQMMNGHRSPSSSMRDKIMATLRVPHHGWDRIFFMHTTTAGAVHGSKPPSMSAL